MIDRQGRHSRLAVFAFLALFAALCIAVDIAYWRLMLAQDYGDFGIFWQSAHAALTGQMPYGVPLGGAKNLNPPFSLVIFAPFGLLPESLAYWTWTTLSVVCYALALVLTRRLSPQSLTPARFIFAVSAAPLWYTLMRGQVETVLLPAVVGVVLLHRAGRLRDAGLMLGVLIAFKPILAVWAFAFLLAGQPRLFRWAVVGGSLASVLAAVMFGPLVYLGWIEAVRANTTGASYANGALLYQFGLPATLLVGLGALALIRYRRPDGLTLSAAGIALSIALSPIVWQTYLVLLVPFLLARHRPFELVGAAFLMVPVLQWQLHLGIVTCLSVLAILALTSVERPVVEKSLSHQAEQAHDDGERELSLGVVRGASLHR